MVAMTCDGDALAAAGGVLQQVIGGGRRGIVILAGSLQNFDHCLNLREQEV